RNQQDNVLYSRSGLADRIRRLVRKCGEVLLEQRGQFASLGIVLGAILPSPSGLQKFRGNAGAILRDLQPEDWIGSKGNRIKIAAQCAANQRARMAELDSFPLAERPSAPAGIDEPGARATFSQLLIQQLRITRRMQRQKRRREAGAE